MGPREFGRLSDCNYVVNRPFTITHLRIYQEVPYAMSQDTWSVLRDAIIDGDKDKAGRIVASDDVMVGWRRSNVKISYLLACGPGKHLFQNVLAGVVWDVDINYMMTCGELIRLAVDNINEYPIKIRPYLVGREWTQEEVDEYRRNHFRKFRTPRT